MSKFTTFLLLSPMICASDVIDDISKREQAVQDERIKAINEQKKSTNIRINSSDENSAQTLTINENPCFEIQNIIINGDKRFENLLKKSLDELKFKSGMCIGSGGIGAIYENFNNKIIESGFITSLAVIPDQNIKSGTLKFEVNVGKIDNVFINDKIDKSMEFSAFGGLQSGNELNLRRTEQALENINNATNGNVSIELKPSQRENHTDIFIQQDAKRPFLFNLAIDNLGSEATGKYQISPTLQLMNIFGLNEVIYGSYSANFVKGDKQSVENETKFGKSNNFYYGASVPFGRFSLDYNENRYSYHQAIAGAYSVYDYSGTSHKRELTLDYLYFRDQISKHHIYFTAWEKLSKNYIENYELDNQRKKTAGYVVGLNSTFFLDEATLKFNLAYKKGTGALGADTALEEIYGGGTNRFEIILLDAGFRTNLSERLSYDFAAHARWNLTPLTMQERLNIGGKYSVRGFDGEMSAAGDHGFYLRNTLDYAYLDAHSAYLALDVGRVSGTNDDDYEAMDLSGGGFGLKGIFTKFGKFSEFGALNYDIFAGFPIYKPKDFKTKNLALNFSVGFTF